MGLGYTYQSSKPMTLIGTKSAANVTTGAALTSTASDNRKLWNTAGMSKTNLSITYTLGAAETTNTLSIVVETSSDATNFYQLVNEAVTVGASVLTQRTFTFVGADATAAYKFSLPLDIQDIWMRISCTESGVASNAGNVYIEAVNDGSK